MDIKKTLSKAVILSLASGAVLVTQDNLIALDNPFVITAFADSQVDNHQINKNALSFIKNYAEPGSYTHWDENLSGLIMTKAQEEELNAFVRNHIIKNPNDSDIEKAKHIFNWITSNVRYASGNQNPKANPYDVMKEKIAVCGGYSNLYKAMLNAVGIPSIIVYGTIPSGSTVNNLSLDPAHQWNAMYIDGEWHYSDSTWGNGYFKKSIAEFSKDHKTTNIHRVSYNDDQLTIGFENSGLSVINISSQDEQITIPSTSNDSPIIALSVQLSANNKTLKKMVLGENIKHFESAALDFENLESIEVSPQNKWYSTNEGVLFSKDLSTIVYYPKNKKETVFTIPKETRIYDEKQTFQNPYLTSFIVEEGNPNFSAYKGSLFNKEQTKLLTVAEGASEVTIPGSVLLDNIALSFKPNLETVTLEEGITTIPDYVFNGSEHLTTVNIPDSVTTISDNAFWGISTNQLTLVGGEQSKAKEFAQRHKIAFRSHQADDQIADDEETERKLEKLISDVNHVKEMDYTIESYITFRNRVSELTSLLARDSFTVNELDSLIESIYQAYANLVPKESIEKQLLNEFLVAKEAYETIKEGIDPNVPLSRQTLEKLNKATITYNNALEVAKEVIKDATILEQLNVYNTIDEQPIEWVVPNAAPKSEDAPEFNGKLEEKVPENAPTAEDAPNILWNTSQNPPTTEDLPSIEWNIPQNAPTLEDLPEFNGLLEERVPETSPITESLPEFDGALIEKKPDVVITIEDKPSIEWNTSQNPPTTENLPSVEWDIPQNAPITEDLPNIEWVIPQNAPTLEDLPEFNDSLVSKIAEAAPIADDLPPFNEPLIEKVPMVAPSVEDNPSIELRNSEKVSHIEQAIAESKVPKNNLSTEDKQEFKGKLTEKESSGNDTFKHEKAKETLPKTGDLNQFSPLAILALISSVVIGILSKKKQNN
ncbi:transglutaminase domain-containing protein [Streptococcus marimammalium]|uniref:transglutaminase domain-containing protein n=1 Tax=Streptococcus marimammalium TaxID=269666 RepID=UPI00035D4B7A|nr:transglutaminase domain-containing protein [Streptococcus marimammalium]